MNDYIITTEYDGKPRRMYLKQCACCQTDFYAPKHRTRRYCSQACFGKASRNRVEVRCAQCGTLHEKPLNKLDNSIHRVYFCSRECKDLAQSVLGKCPEIRPEHYGDGASCYRNRALKHYGSECNLCGYSGLKIMLDVHHKDGNRENPSIENLEVLCVWCHALYSRGVVAQSGERLVCNQKVVGA